MKLPDKVYDVIKYVVCIALPAIQVALLSLTSIFGWSWGSTASECIIVVQTLVAALFCISLAGYNKEENNEKSDNSDS